MPASRADMAAHPAKLKYEPALYLGYLNALLALVAAYFPGVNLTPTAQAAVITIATGILAAITAVLTRPIHVSALVGAATTAVTAAGTFGLHLTDNQMATGAAALSIVLPLILRLIVSPAAVDGDPAPATITRTGRY